MSALATGSAFVSQYREIKREQRQQRRSTLPRLVGAAFVVLLLVLGINQLRNLLPSFSNPFATHTVDNSQPVLIKSLTDLHVYQASQANLQVVVDLKNETDYVPSFLKGTHTLFMATGSVAAGVDFSGLSTSTVIVDKAHHSMSISLPHARLGDATVNVDGSKILDRQRGVFDRIADAFGSKGSDADLYQLGKQKIAAAAAADPTITQKAEDNTRAMLTTLMAPLGYSSVVVTFG